MSPTITMEQAQAKLKELIEDMAPGEEVIIMDDQNPVARLVSEKSNPKSDRPGPGL